MNIWFFIEQARRWSPENARYMELEARLRLLRLPQMLGSGNFSIELDSILDLHRQAAEKRPHWPFSWANISNIKTLQGDFDEEFDQALINAVTYGPFEQTALDRAIYAGIRAWQRDQLSLDSNRAFLVALANSAELQRGFARSIRNRLQDRGLQDELCEQIPFRSDSGQQRICG